MYDLLIFSLTFFKDLKVQLNLLQDFPGCTVTRWELLATTGFSSQSPRSRKYDRYLFSLFFSLFFCTLISLFLSIYTYMSFVLPSLKRCMIDNLSFVSFLYKKTCSLSFKLILMIIFISFDLCNKLVLIAFYGTIPCQN